MGMDFNPCNPQDNRVFEIGRIDGKPNSRNTETNDLTEELVALGELSSKCLRAISGNKPHVAKQPLTVESSDFDTYHRPSSGAPSP